MRHRGAERGLPLGALGIDMNELVILDHVGEVVDARLIDEMGFDVVDLGLLKEGWKVERARPAYCIPMDKARLETTLAQTTRASFVSQGSWRR